MIITGICEDDLEQLGIMETTINKMLIGVLYKIVRGKCAEELLEKVGNKKLDIALLATDLSGMSGLELGAYFKKINQ